MSPFIGQKAEKHRPYRSLTIEVGFPRPFPGQTETLLEFRPQLRRIMNEELSRQFHRPSPARQFVVSTWGSQVTV